MKYSKFSRRMFLQGAGGAYLAIPFLESLIPRVARAADSGPIKRFISVHGNYDYGHHRNFLPTLNKPANAFTPVGEHQMHYASLRSFLADGRPQLSRILGPEMNAFADKMNVFRALDQTNWFGHGSGHLLGNFAGVSNNGHLASLPALETIDQVLARITRFNPNNKPVLVLGTGGSGSYGKDGTGKVVSKGPIASTVLAAYNAIFQNGTYPQSGETVVPTVHPRNDLLTRVLEDYKRIRNGAQISSVDKVVLDNAFDKLSDVQRGIAAEIKEVGASCYHRALDKTQDNTMYRSNLTFKNYANLIVAAILCDTTRVVHFKGTIAGAYDTTPEPEIDFHQGISHSPFNVVGGKTNWEYMGDIQADYMRNFMAPLLTGLEGAIDPANGKSVLYNSLVHWGLEHSNVHGWAGTPTLLAGSAGGAVKTGNYVDFCNYTKPHRGSELWNGTTPADPTYAHNIPGIPYNRMLITVLQAMGVTPAEYESKLLNANWVNRTDGRYGAVNNGIGYVGGYGYISVPNPELDPYPNGRYYGPYSVMNFHHFKNPLPLPG